jgi:DNA repair protein RecN (Recombination protein N)
MLTLLKISQFAIVTELELDLKPGFSVLTGETGAGKSILMDALSLCLGDRAEAAVVRTGAERADISACFDVARHEEARAWLAEHELDQGDECWLRRTISRDGRSRAYINGSPATLADVKTLGEMLIDVHSQHEHQTLLRKDSHRRILDSFGGLTAAAASVEKDFQGWQQAAQRLSRLQSDGAAQAARLDLVNHQLGELEKLGLAAGEYEKIEQDYDTLANLGSLLMAGDVGMNRLSEDDNDNATRALQQALRALEPHRSRAPQLNEVCELIESADIQVREAASTLRHYLDGLDADPARLQTLEDRLGAIHQLARKHRVGPTELLALQAQLQTERDSLTAAQDLDALTAEVARLEQQFFADATALRGKRQQAAEQLSEAIGRHVRDLGMANARLLLQFTALPKPAATGLDDIEFLFSANPGQSPKPLSKVASGGELSRISLSIQVVNARHTAVPVMVFDEVDVGIGGGVAEVVGRLLRDLGANAQLLCITHQPQVAALGHHHLRVEKAVQGGETTTAVVQLSHAERIQEIARMSGGLNISAETLKHAEAMLAGA